MKNIQEFISSYYGDLHKKVKIEVLKDNYKATVVKIVSTNNNDVIVKKYKDNGKVRAEKEFILLQKLFESGLNVPRPIKLFADSINNAYYVYMSYICGETLANIYYRNGKISLNLLLKYCKLCLDIENLSIESEIKKAMISEDYYYNKIVKCYKHRDIFENLGINYVKLSNILYSFQWPKDNDVLIHGDFHFDNIILTKTKELYVIDLEEAFYANFYVEIARIIIARDLYTGSVILALFRKLRDFDENHLGYYILLELAYNVIEYYIFISENHVNKTTIERYNQYLNNLKHFLSSY